MHNHLYPQRTGLRRVFGQSLSKSSAAIGVRRRARHVWVRVCDVYSIATLKNPRGVAVGAPRVYRPRKTCVRHTHTPAKLYNNPIDTLYSSLTYTCATNSTLQYPPIVYINIYAYPAPAAVNDIILFICHTHIHTYYVYIYIYAVVYKLVNKRLGISQT